MVSKLEKKFYILFIAFLGTGLFLAFNSTENYSRGELVYYLLASGFIFGVIGVLMLQAATNIPKKGKRR